LTQQVQTQQATTDLLNQISVRIAEIEMKIFEDANRGNNTTNNN
jgi:hypothetical protein